MVTVRTVEDYVDEKGVVNQEKKKLAVKKAMREFVIKNEADLTRIFHYMTGIYDRDLVHDAIYEFYLRLMEQDALSLYDDTDYSGTEFAKIVGDPVTYETYITNALCWLLPQLAKRNFRHKHVPLPKAYQEVPGKGKKVGTKNKKMHDYYLTSYVARHERRAVGSLEWEDDVFEYVNRDGSYLKVDSTYEASLFDYEENPVLSGYLADFKKFIRMTESPRTAEKMIVYLEQKLAGCKGVAVADVLGVSNNMVKILKYNLQRKYGQWQAETV